MKKLILIIALLIFVLAIGAVLGILPDPLQEQVNNITGKMFPQKKALEDKQKDYLKKVENL